MCPEHCFCGATHEWMSYVFEVFFLFWFVVISLLSSWYKMDVPVKLLTDDVWAAEDNNTGFLSVEVDSLESGIFENDCFPYPLCRLVLNNEKMIHEDKWERTTNRNMRIFMNDQNILFDNTQLMNYIEKSKHVKHLILINVQNILLIDTVQPKEYTLFIQNAEISLEQWKLNFAFLK